MQNIQNDKTLQYLKDLIQSTLLLADRIDQLYEIELEEEIELSTIDRRKIAKISEQTTDFLKTLKSLQYQAREKRRTAQKKAKSVASNKVKPKDESVPIS